MKRLHGLPAAPGIVRAPWIRIDRVLTPAGGRTTADGAAGEIERLEEASSGAAADLEAISREVRADGHADEAGIFEAQAAIARDPALATMATERIKGSHDDAISAILAAADSFALQLRSLEDDLLAARAADVIDVGDRIARRLAGTSEPTVGLERPAIVVAEDLPPSLTATLPRELTPRHRARGFFADGPCGDPRSRVRHPRGRRGARPARSAHGDSGAEATGELAIDGATGEVVVDPDDATTEALRR